MQLRKMCLTSAFKIALSLQFSTSSPHYISSESTNRRYDRLTIIGLYSKIQTTYSDTGWSTCVTQQLLSDHSDCACLSIIRDTGDLCWRSISSKLVIIIIIYLLIKHKHIKYNQYKNRLSLAVRLSLFLY